MFEQIVLWLFVVFSGIAAGAGLYEMRITVPQWFNRSTESGVLIDARAMRKSDAGRRFWAYITTGPLTLLTLVSLLISRQSANGVGEWWFFAAMVILAERVMTLGYFIPNAIKLMRAEMLHPFVADAIAVRWVSFNYVRAALALLGWLAALKALSLLS